MKVIFAALIVLIACTTCVADGTRRVAAEVVGKYYNEVWKKWALQPVNLYVDKEGTCYLDAGESLLRARGYVHFKDVPAFYAALVKSQEWSKKAKEAKLETTKPLAEFQCFGEESIRLRFFSANKGEQTDVIMKVRDYAHEYTKIELYLDSSQVATLLAALDKVPATVKELKEQEEKAEILK